MNVHIFPNPSLRNNTINNYDMKVAKNHKRYLTITQSEAQDKNRVIVFANIIQNFATPSRRRLNYFATKNESNWHRLLWQS